VSGEGLAARLIAYLVGRDPDAPRPSLIDVKQHCAERLPRSMIPDAVRWLPAMPRTGNGKVDRLKLVALATTPKKES
jgi:acyl-coenzyme A synthetase/AMP-(fatty) acid ligase